MAGKKTILPINATPAAGDNGECFDILSSKIETMSGSIRNVETAFLAARAIDLDKANAVFDECYLAHVMQKDRRAKFHAMAWGDVVLAAREVLGKKGYSSKFPNDTSRQSEDDMRRCSSVRMARKRIIDDNTVRTDKEIEDAKEKASKAMKKRAADKVKAAKAAKAELRAAIEKEAIPKFSTYDDMLEHVMGMRQKLAQLIERNSSAFGSHVETFAALRSASDILSTVPQPIKERPVKGNGKKAAK